MNRKLAEERDSMMSLDRWEIIWMGGCRGGVCRVTNLIDVGGSADTNRKFVFLERRSGNRPSEKLFRYIIEKTTKRFLSIHPREPVEYSARPSGGYRIWLRTGSGRSIRVDGQGGVLDFLLPADELSKLVSWFEHHEPIHAQGEDVAFYAI